MRILHLFGLFKHNSSRLKYAACGGGGGGICVAAKYHKLTFNELSLKMLSRGCLNIWTDGSVEGGGWRVETGGQE